MLAHICRDMRLHTSALVSRSAMPTPQVDVHTEMHACTAHTYTHARVYTCTPSSVMMQWTSMVGERVRGSALRGLHVEWLLLSLGWGGFEVDKQPLNQPWSPRGAGPGRVWGIEGSRGLSAGQC